MTVRAYYNEIDPWVACGAAVLPACGVGAPHIRQRLWFVADSERGATERRRYDVATTPQGFEGEAREREWLRDDVRPSEQPSILGHADDARSQGRSEHRNGTDELPARPASMAGTSLDNPTSPRQQPARQGTEGKARHEARLRLPSDGRTESFWSDAEFIPCTDGKARPVKPGIFPLAHGLPTSMAKLGPELGELARLAGLHRISLAGAKRHRIKGLRGAGNAIVAEVGAEFIKATQRSPMKKGE